MRVTRKPPSVSALDIVNSFLELWATRKVKLTVETAACETAQELWRLCIYANIGTERRELGGSQSFRIRKPGYEEEKRKAECS